ncbi:RNA chaperone Hfq [Spirulina subsalsa FACHB-351]|uniref:RNA chaperone Hfq n=1 Tax=Spirulina subsalsa FACHB-351 TaxID=234711 RepID=A0ABT3L201_9CYAN|nr:RNA chaperone Hfq [Spirulina subsalsa]MCW6035521.1 RNA chaperone Hfq [Spirulina subsalsa FACHB-351]
MTDFDTGLPSTRQLQNFNREKVEVEFKLMTGDVITGKMVWQDAQCICLQDASEQLTVIWRQAIAYHKPLG